MNTRTHRLPHPLLAPLAAASFLLPLLGVDQFIHRSLADDSRANSASANRSNPQLPSTKSLHRRNANVSRNGSQPHVIHAVTLESGRVIEVGSLLRTKSVRIERRLNRLVRKQRLLQIDYSIGNGTFALVGHIDGTLNGPTAAYLDGSIPVAYYDYRDGDRNGSFIIRDNQLRPLLFEQYRSGRRHGIRCLYKACSDTCSKGHVWLVQEWSSGKLQQMHLVRDNEETTTYTPFQRPEMAIDTELKLAIAELKSIEDELDADEEHLKKALANRSRAKTRTRSRQRKQTSLASQSTHRSRLLPLNSANAKSLHVSPRGGVPRILAANPKKPGTAGNSGLAPISSPRAAVTRPVQNC